tara:strand:- start:55227 stop:57506 length:2280 start_codon:yes stop_codon:yes gene_type:complete
MDPNPSPIGRSLVESVTHPVRITQPMVRKGWLQGGMEQGREDRGGDVFVPVSWERATELVAAELSRVKKTFGNTAIYAGSYGWASAGRFHHAQSQMRRFLNLFGGHINAVNSYSFAAAEVVVPHVVGSFYETIFASTTLASIAEHGQLVVAFGGWPLKNAQVNAGGVGKHEVKSGQQACKDAGVDFVYVGPTRNDMAEQLGAHWLRPRPSTDTAVMLGIAHTLQIENLHDKAFLASHCVGYEKFEPYLLGLSDGTPKDADWAAKISGLSAEDIRQLARKMASHRTLVTASWSLQRAEYGEQPYWMLITLAAMLGQIGMPGAGFGFGHAAAEGIGTRWDHPIRPAALPVPPNPVPDVYPVSRIADLLLNPGGECAYDGQTLVFPDTRLVYWCGGNPFHHHQDINRLLEAWRRPETIIVHEPWWTSTARHADIVLPCTTSLERNDFTSGHCDWTLQVMEKAVAPYAQARNEYDIFSDLAQLLGFGKAFTEGRDEQGWLRHLFEQTVAGARSQGFDAPDFEQFWSQGYWELPDYDHPKTLLNSFREDPEARPLATPSGKVEIYSDTIAGFAYPTCPAHPTWLEPQEWLGAAKAQQYPFHLISNQPGDKLHGQLDFAINSREAKVNGRTALRISPTDAHARGIASGDTVRLFNDRGACLAGAVVTDDVQSGVLILPTGSWYDPLEPGVIGSLDVHGNPNMLTRDAGTSQLAQGPISQSCLVDVEKYTGALPPIKVHEPPLLVDPKKVGFDTLWQRKMAEIVGE